MIEQAGTSDFRRLLANEKGLRAVTTWFLQQGILSQFSWFGKGRDDEGEEQDSMSTTSVS